MTWSLDSALLVELDSGTRAPDARTYRVEGLPGFERAEARIVTADAPRPAGPHLRFWPLTEPPGPFDLDSILWLTPFVERSDTRETLLAFERRIGRRYYEFMAAARIRYAAACGVEAHGVDLTATCAEVYAVDARTKAELNELDASTSPEPPDVLEFYRECSALKVPGSGRHVFLLPE